MFRIIASSIGSKASSAKANQSDIIQNTKRQHRCHVCYYKLSDQAYRRRHGSDRVRYSPQVQRCDSSPPEGLEDANYYPFLRLYAVNQQSRSSTNVSTGSSFRISALPCGAGFAPETGLAGGSWLGAERNRPFSATRLAERSCQRWTQEHANLVAKCGLSGI